MEGDRIEALMAEEFTPARLRPLQIIYLALVMGVVVLFGVGTFLGLQSTGEEVDEVAALIAWLSSDEVSFSTGAVFDISGGRATY